MRRTIFFTTLFICSIFFSQSVLAWNYLNTLNDSSTAKNFTFTTSENVTTWIRLPKQSRVIDAKLNLSGYVNGGEQYNLTAGSICTAVNNFMMRWGSNVGGTHLYAKFWFNISTPMVLYNVSFYGYNLSTSPKNNVSIYICQVSDYDNTTCTGPDTKLVTVNMSSFTNSGYDAPIKNIIVLDTPFSISSGTIYHMVFNRSTTEVDSEWDIYSNSGPVSCPYGSNYMNFNGVLSCNGVNITFEGTRYPNSPYLDASGDGDKEWSYTGEFNQTNNRTANFSSEINSYLSTCTPDANGNCDVPLILHSDTAGKIQVSDINVTYGSPPVLTGTVTTPITYETASDYSGSESNNGDSDCSYILLRNGTQIAVGSSVSDTTVLGVGAYNYTYYTAGCTNYTSGKDEKILTVNKKNANVQVYPVTQTVTYPTTQTQYCTDDATLTNCQIYRNDSSITNNTAYSPAVGVYVYKANITDQTNYTGYSDTETLTVNKGAAETYLYLNGTSSDRTYPQYSEANLTGVVNISTLTVYLDMNATGWGNNFASGTGSVINISNMSMPLGTYNITAHFDGNQNYTSSSKTYYVTITDATTPQYSNLKTSPISPTAYSPGQAYQFNATWTDNAAVDKIIFEWNGANTTVTTYQGSEYYITKNDLPAGTYNYRWYANDTSNNWGSTSLYVYTVNKRPAEVTLYLNGSSATKWYQSGATANFTVYSNVSTTVVLTANITGWTDQEATQTIYNTTALTGGDGTAYNITGYVKDTANYTGTLSDTEYAKMDSSKPTVYSFSVNDSYANMNQTVLLSVNATDGFAGIDTVLAEVQKPSGKANYTLPLSASGNYSRLVNKTDLGDTQNDIGRINITKIYVNDTANNVQANTTSLHFDYAQTNALDWGDSPDPITNAEGQAVTIWANYTDLESTILTGSTCRVTVFGYTWDMSYIDTNKRYEITISTYNRTPDTYAYNISCANSSYQTQQCTNSSQTVEVKEVVTGGPVGGGGGGEAPQPLANFTMTPETWNVIISPNRTFERSFHICNKDTRTIKIKFEPTGEYSQWVSMVRYKEEKFLYQAIPAYGVPGGIDFLILEPGICDDISVDVAVPEVPDSTYEIGLRAREITTGSSVVSKFVISVQRGVGTIRELYDKLVSKLLFGVYISPEIKNVEICQAASTDICIPGAKEMKIPFLGMGLTVLASYSVWRFTRRRFPKASWVFVLISIITILLIIP